MQISVPISYNYCLSQHLSKGLHRDKTPSFRNSNKNEVQGSINVRNKHYQFVSFSLLLKVTNVYNDNSSGWWSRYSYQNEVAINNNIAYLNLGGLHYCASLQNSFILICENKSYVVNQIL